LRSITDRVQHRFEDICKDSFHITRIKAFIDLEDGFEYEGYPEINVLLYSNPNSRRPIAETTYSFREDGIYSSEDEEESIGDTIDDLVEDIAYNFASAYDLKLNEFFCL
jgi:hypothetical protein